MPFEEAFTTAAAIEADHLIEATLPGTPRDALVFVRPTGVAAASP
jgi:hypothetical protein